MAGVGTAAPEYHIQSDLCGGGGSEGVGGGGGGRERVRMLGGGRVGVGCYNFVHEERATFSHLTYLWHIQSL